MTHKSKKQRTEIKLSKKDVKFTGVTGGIAEYYKQDPAWVRVGAVVLIILTGIVPGLLIYSVFYLLMKKTSEGKKTK